MRWMLAVALLVLPALGAEVAFETAPRLTGTFQVVVTGVAEAAGEVTLVVLGTGQVLRVDLQREGDELRSGPIFVRRACDPLGDPHLVAAVGDTIVAATDLGGGLSATARVGPRARGSDEPTLILERWDNVNMEWVGAEEMSPALFRIVLHDLSLDTSCDRDEIELPVVLGGKEFLLPLTEGAPTSGSFAGEFVVTLEPRACYLWLLAATVEGGLLAEAPLPPGACLICRWEDAALRAPLPLLPITLAPSDPLLPVGCVGEVRLAQPERPDEVRWCVDGAERVGGLSFALFADAPRTVSVVALVRTGLLWDRAETVVTFVPQLKLSFVDAATGLRASEPWPCTQEVQIKAQDVTGDAPVVVVGRLGPDPRSQEITLERAADGVFVSRPLRPADFGACAGDVLWAQYKHPSGCHTVYILLALR